MTGAAPADAAPRRTLIAFGAVSFCYFAYAGLFGTYAPLWFQSLGYSTFAIGVLASVQSATRVLSPYAWGWVADHTGRRVGLLRLAVALSLLCACGFLVTPSYAWIVGVTAALFVCTSGVVPISEAALAHFVSRGGALDAGRYGRVRVWGSVGFILAVSASGFILQWLGVGRFPWLAIVLLVALLGAVARLPALPEAAPHAADAAGALAVLRQPAVAWFFAGVFFTVLAHTSLYAFFSLYLDSLGFSRSAVGLVWATAVVVEVLWFWFEGAWLGRMSMSAWLVLAALASVLRFAVVAAFGSYPWLLVPSQALHALSFAAQHTAVIALINRHFQGRLRGRGQALYTVLGYGISGVIGGVAGGALSQAFGFAAVFWAASAAALVATLCCVRAWTLERRIAPGGGPLTAGNGRSPAAGRPLASTRKPIVVADASAPGFGSLSHRLRSSARPGSTLAAMEKTDPPVRPAHKARRRIWLAGAIGLLVATGVALAFSPGVRDAVAKLRGLNDTKPVVALEFSPGEVVRPAYASMPIVIEFSGPLVAPRTAVVRAKAPGTLLGLRVAEGSRVKAGQALGEIDLADLHTRVVDRAALVDSARANLAEAERQHAANVGLASQNFISPTALLTSQARLDAARAQLRSAEAQLSTSRIGVQEAALVAPISGIVGKRHVVPGEKVSAEQQLLTVVDLSTLELAGTVGTHEVALLQPGQPVDVRVEGQAEAVPGRIDRIAPAAEAGTRAIGVVVVLDNRGERFRAGQYAQARVRLADAAQRLTVPTSAVGQAAGQDYVWTVEHDALVRRIVVTGRTDTAGGRTEVTQGLAPEAQVLALRFDNLKEGAPAKLLPQRSAPTASNPASAAPKS